MLRTIRWYIVVAGLVERRAVSLRRFNRARAGRRGGEHRPEAVPAQRRQLRVQRQGVVASWPAEGPKKLWQVEVGFGKSAVVEADGQAYTAAETDNQQFAVCLDPATGATRWKHCSCRRRTDISNGGR